MAFGAGVGAGVGAGPIHGFNDGRGNSRTR